MQQTTRQMPGPLATPKAFRRPIGAHVILVSLLLSDLCSVLFWLVSVLAYSREIPSFLLSVTWMRSPEFPTFLSGFQLSCCSPAKTAHV